MQSAGLQCLEYTSSRNRLPTAFQAPSLASTQSLGQLAICRSFLGTASLRTTRHAGALASSCRRSGSGRRGPRSFFLNSFFGSSRTVCFPARPPQPPSWSGVSELLGGSQRLFLRLGRRPRRCGPGPRAPPMAGQLVEVDGGIMEGVSAELEARRAAATALAAERAIHADVLSSLCTPCFVRAARS